MKQKYLRKIVATLGVLALLFSYVPPAKAYTTINLTEFATNNTSPNGLGYLFVKFTPQTSGSTDLQVLFPLGFTPGVNLAYTDVYMNIGTSTMTLGSSASTDVWGVSILSDKISISRPTNWGSIPLTEISIGIGSGSSIGGAGTHYFTNPPSFSSVPSIKVDIFAYGVTQDSTGYISVLPTYASSYGILDNAGAPGQVYFPSYTSDSITVGFGTVSSISNFSTYVVRYATGTYSTYASLLAANPTVLTSVYDYALGFQNYNNLSSMSVTGLQPSTAYTFYISARDGSNNEFGPLDAPVSVSTNMVSGGGQGQMGAVGDLATTTIGATSVVLNLSTPSTVTTSFSQYIILLKAGTYTQDQLFDPANIVLTGAMDSNLNNINYSGDVSLSGLTAGTLYSVMIVAMDGSSNPLAASAVTQFTTAGGGASAVPEFGTYLLLSIISISGYFLFNKLKEVNSFNNLA